MSKRFTVFLFIIIFISPSIATATNQTNTTTNGNNAGINNTLDTSILILSTIGIGGIITTIMTFIFNKRSVSHKAYTDYVYEAKKKMYEKLYPTLFQYSEFAESASLRIVKLAEKIREGNVVPGSGWLSQDGYLMNTTIYALLIPNAAFRIIQKQLTQFDLHIEPKIKIQYQLAKELYYTFSSDKDTAKCEPFIEYDADALSKVSSDKKDKMLAEKPEVYSRQSIFVRNLDKLADELIRVENGTFRVITYAEFEKQYASSIRKKPFKIAYDLFENFHPKTRPVLWRILLVQAHLYKIFCEMHSQNYENLKSIEPKDVRIDNHELDWRTAEERISIKDEELKNELEGAKNRVDAILNKLKNTAKNSKVVKIKKFVGTD